MMWPARLLLLVVASSAASPSPPFFSLPIPISPPIEDVEDKQQNITRVEKEIDDIVDQLSYAEVSTWVPDEVLAFLESLTADDIEAGEKASEEAPIYDYLVKHLNDTAYDIALYAYNATYEALTHISPDLAARQANLQAWFLKQFSQLEKRNQRRFQLLLAAGLIVGKELAHDFLPFLPDVNEAEQILLDEARKELIDRPLFDKGVQVDVVAQFPKLGVFFATELYEKLQELYKLEYGDQPPFE